MKNSDKILYVLGLFWLFLYCIVGIKHLEENSNTVHTVLRLISAVAITAAYLRLVLKHE